LTMVKIAGEKRAVANRTDRCSHCGRCIISCNKNAVEFAELTN
jgi:NAD-dependent dihydropyrimidine dehydrogenase PreA subunit